MCAYVTTSPNDVSSWPRTAEEFSVMNPFESIAGPEDLQVDGRGRELGSGGSGKAQDPDEGTHDGCEQGPRNGDRGGANGH